MSARTHPALARRAQQVAADRARSRRRMVSAVGIAAAGALVGWWLVTGPVLAAQNVRLSGYDGPDRVQLERALNDAAGGGSLLRAPVGDLRTTALTSAWVSDVIVSRDLPLGIVVEVIPAQPIAVVTAPGGVSMLVSARGRVMGPSEGRGANLPRIRGSVDIPVIAGQPVPKDLTAAVTFAAALEPRLAARIRALQVEGGRLTGRLGTTGPRLIIGPPQRLAAKATALAVLTDTGLSAQDVQAATYIDLTLPERPAVGGLGSAPVEPAPIEPAPAEPAT